MPHLEREILQNLEKLKHSFTVSVNYFLNFCLKLGYDYVKHGFNKDHISHT